MMNFKKAICAFGLIPVLTAGIFSFSNAQNKNIVMRSNIPYNVLSNIWGYVDTTGQEYALVGANNGLSVVNVNNPTAPFKRFFIPGPTSNWREIRTWGKYAYVTTEAGTGVKIVDMSHFPDTIFSKNYTGDGLVAGQINQIHALHIDNGKLYLYGGDLQDGKAKVFSLLDPWNPVYLGTVSNNYVHDGFVSNDTLYSCQIYDGTLEIIDARNPLAPVVINTQLTPKQFTHNSWMSTNRKVIYTTDEVEGSWVTSYDISDLSNIKELDRYQSDGSVGSIGHNTYVLNNQAATGHNTDFLLTSYYTDGVTIVDASRPDNLVQVGNYDTSPTHSGGTFNGAWGVYGFLPSGNLLISDIENGMFVLTPTYKRACFLEGIVKDKLSQQSISNATITVLNKSELNTSVKLNGEFKTGTVDSGTYTVHVSAPGYIAQNIQNVVLQNGQVTNLTIQLDQRVNFSLSGHVKDSISNLSIANATVVMQNDEFSLIVNTDGSGNFTLNPFYAGTYAVYIGKEGYHTKFVDSINYTQASGVLNFTLNKGFYDDFLFDNNWTVNSSAPRGIWERAEPIGTTNSGVTINPDFDANDDFGDQCFITGNGGGGAGSDDVDNGFTHLLSPIFDLSSFTEPAISYQRWFANSGGAGNPNDSLIVKLSNGTITKIVETVTASSQNNNTWVKKQFRVIDFMPATSTMQLFFETADDAANGHLLEAGVDKVQVKELAVVGIDHNFSKNGFMIVQPNPIQLSSTINYAFNGNQNIAELQIVNLNGQVIYKQHLSQNKGAIAINNLFTNGVYFVKIITDNEVFLQKVIK